jgi:hypothetical protein
MLRQYFVLKHCSLLLGMPFNDSLTVNPLAINPFAKKHDSLLTSKLLPSKFEIKSTRCFV